MNPKYHATRCCSPWRNRGWDPPSPMLHHGPYWESRTNSFRCSLGSIAAQPATTSTASPISQWNSHWKDGKIKEFPLKICENHGKWANPGSPCCPDWLEPCPDRWCAKHPIPACNLHSMPRNNPKRGAWLVTLVSKKKVNIKMIFPYNVLAMWNRRYMALLCLVDFTVSEPQQTVILNARVYRQLL